MAKTSSFSIVPDSLITAGTAFGILLGLAVGVLTGMMISDQTSSTQLTTSTGSRATVEEMTMAGVRTLLVERASLLADALRLQAAGQAADPVLQLLTANGKQLNTKMARHSGQSSAQVFVRALETEAQLATNLAIQVASGNRPNISAAQAHLTAETSDLQAAFLAVSSGTRKDIQPIVVQHIQAVQNLALTVQKTQTYQAESVLVTSFDALATYLQNNPR